MIRVFVREVNLRVVKIIALLIFIIVLGTSGYMYLEGYSFVDSLYMTFITVTTVGFSEVMPLSDIGKIFTIILICFSLGVIGFIVSSFGKYIVEGYLAKRIKDYKINKKIMKSKDHVIVCGFGRNGRQAVIDLLEHNETVVVIDKNEERIEMVKEVDENILYVYGDATHDEDLIKAGIKEAKALITAMPNDADNVYVVLTARELNHKLRIIARSSDMKADIRLKRAGADNVVMPDRIGGSRMAKLVSRPDIVEFLDRIFLQSSRIETVPCESMASCFDNRSIKEVNIRNQSGASIIGVKDSHGQFIFNPSSDFLLKNDQKLFVLGSPDQVSRLFSLLTKGK